MGRVRLIARHRGGLGLFLRRSLLAAAMAFAAAPAAAEFLPRPDEIALPEEKPVIQDVLTKLLDNPRASPEQSLEMLDAALARLTQPTRLRGLVQFGRANALTALER